MDTVTYKFQPAIQILYNSSKTLKFQLKDDNDNTINLEDVNDVVFYVYKSSKGEDTEYISTSATILEEEKGEIEVNLTDNDTNIDTGIYYYIIEVEKSEDETLSFGKGVFEILGDDDSRIQEIKKNKGLAFDYYLMKNALDYAHNEIYNTIFIEETEEFSKSRDEIVINSYVADANLDGEINEDDIKLIQYQNEPPYDYQDLSSEIDKFIPNHPNGKSIIMLKDKYPEDSYTLQLKYSKVTVDYSKLKLVVGRLEEIYVMIYLLDNVEANHLQRGITQKQILNQSINFDQSALKEYRNRLYQMAQREVMQVRPLNARSVRISKDY